MTNVYDVFDPLWQDEFTCEIKTKSGSFLYNLIEAMGEGEIEDKIGTLMHRMYGEPYIKNGEMIDYFAFGGFKAKSLYMVSKDFFDDEIIRKYVNESVKGEDTMIAEYFGENVKIYKEKENEETEIKHNASSYVLYEYLSHMMFSSSFNHITKSKISIKGFDRNLGFLEIKLPKILDFEPEELGINRWFFYDAVNKLLRSEN